MPALTKGKFLEMSDKRLWRIVRHYISKAMKGIELSGLQAFSLDESKSRKGYRCVTVFISCTALWYDGLELDTKMKEELWGQYYTARPEG